MRPPAQFVHTCCLVALYGQRLSLRKVEHEAFGKSPDTCWCSVDQSLGCLIHHGGRRGTARSGTLTEEKQRTSEGNATNGAEN